MNKTKKYQLPHTLVIIFSIVVIIALLTHFIPGGSYDRIEKDGRTIVIGDSFHYVKSQPQGLGALLMAPFRGFVEAAQIIAFVIIVGGAFSVIQSTGAIDGAIRSISAAHSQSRLLQSLMIPLLMTIFALAGAIFGMSEEVIPFILVFIPLALSLGYDSIVGTAIPFLGAGAGFAGAFINPFTIGIAQGIAELPPVSGIFYRIFCWVIITGLAIVFVSRYAAKIRSQPELSPTFEMDQQKRKQQPALVANDPKITTGHLLVLISFGMALILLVVGVLKFGWYIPEIAALFFGASIIAGAAARLKPSKMAESFVNGTKDMMNALLIIAFARGILVIASDGQIIDTILNALSSQITRFHPIFAGQAMFLVQTFINFFIPSGSGQAALTMPIMAPLSDLIGVTRQTAVLAFQFGDGFSNMIIPTSGVTMAVLGMGKIPWEKWAKWLLPLMLLFVLIGLILLIPPVIFHWGPF
ncbi:MAG TPA: putative basic amino acid antiporter YfcC [bacterium]|nr:putative basic amino acid antiporter YfcC [bacterium]